MIVQLPDKTEVILGREEGVTNKPTAITQEWWKIQFNGYTLRMNETGLHFFFAEKLKQHDPHAKKRCVRDYPWQCPYMQQQGHPPCVRPKRQDKKELVRILTSNWIRTTKAPTLMVGNGSYQQGLFPEPCWVNTQTGETRFSNEERPYTDVDLVCKPFGVASMKYLQKIGFSAEKWRILPLKDDKRWIEAEQVKQKGKVKPCVFDADDL